MNILQRIQSQVSLYGMQQIQNKLETVDYAPSSQWNSEVLFDQIYGIFCQLRKG